ncbi:MAG: transposase [Verrucomicrobiae bacterium]|nr:transposase [Verrucomicrobiae bacterium]
MKDAQPIDHDSLVDNLKGRIALLEERNCQLEEHCKLLEKRNETFARLVLDLQETVKKLQDEINRLKGQKSRPKIPPSTLDNGKGKNSGTTQRSRLNPITGPKRVRHQEIIIRPENIPTGSRFKGYSDYNVEELLIEVLKIRYRLAIYQSPTGEVLRGSLPVELRGKHFGPELIAYCLDQYHGRAVTRPQLLEQLHGFGIVISAGELDNILIVDKDDFHKEKAAVFEAGIANSNYLNTDDTGARHAGKNGYCTHIGSPLFSFFESTSSKSRINFLEILRGRYSDYILSEDALLYAFEQEVSEKTQEILDDCVNRRFKTKDSWEHFLKKKGICSEKDQRIATEAALLGSAIAHGLNPDMIIMSDAAGQFRILIHALCWIHEERHYRKFIPLTEEESVLVAGVRDMIWDLYENLKTYKRSPTPELRAWIEESFDGLFDCVTSSAAINELFKNTKSRRDGLLRALDYPYLPLHNNDSERDIREYVKRRKISGGTRSELGRRARDTFTSLKKTCVKLGVCFWDYLRDRVGKRGYISPLPTLIAARARGSPCGAQ